MRKAAIYLRVSTGRQATDGVSLDAQDRLNRAYAAEHGFTVAPEHVYREAHSGGELFEREELMRLVESAKRREFQAVIVDCMDRWVRDDDFGGWLNTELRRAGVELHFATETYTDDLAGGIQKSLKRQFAQEERRKNSQRTRKVFEERLAQGKLPGIGPAPFGYQKEKVWVDTTEGGMWVSTGAFLVDPEEATFVRRIFTLAANGYSANSIRKLLNAEGVPPPSASPNKRYSIRGVEWSTGTVAALLRDPVYYGERAVRRQRSLAVAPEEKLRRAQLGFSPTANIVVRPKEEWVLLPVPAIVSRDVWDAAQATIARGRPGCLDRQSTYRTLNEKRPALLRGLIRCAKCGLPMHPDWTPAGKLAYRCRSRQTEACGARTVPGSGVETAVWEQVAAFLADPVTVAHELRQRLAQGPDPALTAALTRSRKDRADAEKRQERLLTLFAAGGDMPLTLIQKQLADAEREKERLDGEIAGLERQVQANAATRKRVQSLIDYCNDRAGNLGTADFAEKRQRLEELGVVVAAVRPTRSRPYPVDALTMTIPGAVAGKLERRQGGTADGTLKSGSSTSSQSSVPEPADPFTFTLSPRRKAA